MPTGGSFGAILPMATGGSSGASLLIFLLPVALIGFMVWSQRRRQREVQTLQSALVVGDEVVTTSGLFGRITDIEASVVTLEVSPGVLLRFDRRAIGSRTTTPSSSTETSTETSAETGSTEPGPSTTGPSTTE